MKIAGRLNSVFIEDEMQRSYLDYSMSMITARALPDVRDGLKPVHRRVLYGLHELGLSHTRPPKKCARVVGDVIGKYHPHGDAAVYDSLVRMAQEFSLRYPMVRGQGNFGSIDGDPPAAMRYTECRMMQIAEEMLTDIDKETVDFAPNYDDSLREPEVMPARVPFLLVNGITGIAVGMATNMAPHNLGEVCDAVVATIDNPDIELHDLLKIIPGPDFPTGGVIYGRSGIVEAYRGGKGRVVVRARCSIEETAKGTEQIVITEIPYMVNKAMLLEKTGELVRHKTIEGISFIRDESDRSGLRVVIGIKKDNYGEVVLNKLYKYTNLQNTFAINNLALVKLQPKLMGLKELIGHYIDHRHEVTVRRTEHDLRKARERLHILEGYRIALDNIDEVVETIKSSSSPSEALTRLQERFKLREIQAKAILDMRLQRLTGLEREKIENEYRELLATVEELEAILASREKRMELIKNDLLDVKDRYADPRRTEIVDNLGESDIAMEDMIADEDMIITMSHAGYIKRCSLSTYRAQGRGGRGVKGMESKDGDFVENMIVASAHSYILFFTNTGRCYWLKVYRIPEAGRQSRGRPIVNMLSLREGEVVASYVTVKEFDETHFLVIATEKGIVNKQPLKAYSNVRRDGINAIRLDPNDRLINVRLTYGDDDIVLGTRNGQAVRFHESATRELGRNTRGMKGITLRGGDKVVSMVVVRENDTILTVTENGYGKRTLVGEYRRTNRGGSGIINIKSAERNGPVVGLREIRQAADVMLITRNGILIRSDAESISVIGRNTQGVKLMSLSEDDIVVDVALCSKTEPEEVAEEAGGEEKPEEGASSSEGPESA